VSFDVKCLITNIPLKKVINIIIKRVYDEKLISTQLKKRTLIKETISTMNFTDKSTAFQSFHFFNYISEINPYRAVLALFQLRTLVSQNSMDSCPRSTRPKDLQRP
jgi:hypothetical protein